MKKKCVILGAGGHARMLVDCLQNVEAIKIEGILDSNPALIGMKIYGNPIIGNDEMLSDLREKGVEYFMIGLGGTGNNKPRKQLFELALTYGLKPLGIRHPSSIVSSKARIDNSCQLMPGCIINAGAQLGKNVIVNSGAIVEHDCTIGNHIHIATGAKLASTITIGEGAHVGAGASIRQCINIGEYAVIGMGTVVVKNVPANVTVVGNPARILNKRTS